MSFESTATPRAPTGTGQLTSSWMAFDVLAIAVFH
jgi:hypothetical protein